MMSTKICSLLVACLLTPACVVGEAPGGDATCTEGKCDGTGGGACSDKRYGDGTCDTELECAAPDIDCFLTFENDQTAATWYGGLEEQIAASEAREPRAILGDSDPRFARARDLLDRGWKAFRDQRPVGKLFGLRPGLVIVEDDEANAFVITDFADTNKAGFAVMVHTGFLDSRSDDQTLGVMMHEFQHAIGLHVIDGVSDRLRKFYVASPNNEPLGYEATENAQARTYGETWRLFASEVGPYSTAVLGGFPTDGDIKRAFDHVRRMGSAANPTACQNAQTLGMAAAQRFMGAIDPLGGALTGDLTGLSSELDAMLAAFKNECLAGLTVDLVDVTAEMAGTTREMIEPLLSPEDLTLVKGKHVIDGIVAITKNRRQKMRDTEAAFTAAVGQPWSMLRYYSDEENADDVTAPVLRAAGLNPMGAADFMVSMVAEDHQEECRSLIDQRLAPPYGVDLLDQHHDGCWRGYHITAVADDTAKARRAAVRSLSPAIELPPRFPIPKKLTDYVKY